MLIGLLVGSGKNNGPNHGHFDYWRFAHWHVPAIIEGWWLVNGSLSGTSEFDPSCGRHSGPAQVGLLMGRHGIAGRVPFAGGRNSTK